MNSEATKHNIQFLSRGGEMGELIRTKDWSTTSVGPIKTWPQSLCTTLSIILNSKFPMFLWWGRDLTCFYNDAYRPSLGINGKHPSILGMPAAEAWPEIWDVIKPLIDQVLAGGDSTWSEDQLIPIYRNGRLEDVYWTFSYSPVNDESGKPAGVFVTCTETTDKIIMIKELQESRDEFHFSIEASELGTFDYNPATNRFSANDRLKEWFGLPAASEIELSTAISVMAERDRERVTQAIHKALDFPSGMYDVVYTIIHPITGIERIVQAKGRAWFGEDKVAYRFNGTVQDVTPRILAQKKLEESERKLRSIISQAPVAISIFRGRDYVVEITNVNALKMWGREEREVLNKPILEAMPELLPQGIKKLLDDVYHTGKTFSATESPVRMVRNGKLQTFYISFMYEAVRDIEDKITGIMAVGFEVTEQVLARQKLEESEDRFRKVADSAPVLIWMSDTDKLCVFFNKDWLSFTGRTMQQEVGNGWEEGINPEDLSACLNVYNTAFDAREEFYMEYRLRRADGEYRWVSDKGVPRFTTEGIFEGYIGACMDIHERVVYHQKLKEDEEKLNIVIEASELGTWELNVKTNKATYSSRYLEILGYPKGSVVEDKSLIKHIHPEDLPLREAALKDAYKTGFFSYQPRVVWNDQSIHWIESKGKVFYDEQHNPDRLIGTTRDITKEKLFATELERQVQERTRELAHKNKELEKMNSELQSFAYVSSHDLQEPLRKIQTFANRIMEREVLTLSESGRDYFQRMQAAAKRMQILIEDLLAYSRASTTDRNFENVNLADLFEQVKIELKEEILQSGALVESTELCTAHVIPFQFRQLLNNLISNSIKFAKPNSTPVIQLRSEITEGDPMINPALSPYKSYCHFTISDNGIGFDPQYKDRIFEVFQRLHGRSEYKGTGIGLAIVKKIVENHNGIIIATGEVNIGATFDIYIPVG